MQYYALAHVVILMSELNVMKYRESVLQNNAKKTSLSIALTYIAALKNKQRY